MPPTARCALLIGTVAALVGVRVPALRAQALERGMYVSVLDERGAPVPGLTADDFIIREDNVRREILRVLPATEPMQIALLVDNSQASSHHTADIRDGLKGFVDAMPRQHEMALIAYGDRPTVLVEYTTDPVQLKKGIDRLFPVPGSGAYLLDAIIETTRGFRKREASRPVIVVIGIEDVEFSNAHYEQVLGPLRESGAALHALILGTPGSADFARDETRNRSIVIDRGTLTSGGRRDQLLASMAYGPRLRSLASELTSQYLVVYARPQSLIPPEKLDVTTTNDRLTARGTPVKARKGA